jgi:nucleotide-binding universal stress UspA family protein
MYKRILVIAGDQTWIDASVEYAIALAASTGAELSLLIIKKVTACARQPLLVVTVPPEESYDGIEWSRLLVVHDDSPRGEALVHYALVLAQAASLDVCLLYVNALRQHDAVDSFSRTQHGQDIWTLAPAQAAMTGTNHAVILGVGNIVTAIVETAAAKACGVIAFGVAPYSGWQRLVYRHTVKAVLASTTLPLLLLNRSVIYM